MPNGNDITANAADGTQHIFPAGTDVAVIDAVMKRYASDQTQAGFDARRAKGLGVSPSIEKPGLWDETIGQGGKGLEGFSDWLRDSINTMQQRNLGKVASGGAPESGVPLKTGVGGAMADVAGLGSGILKSPLNTLLTALAALGPIGRILSGSVVAGQSIGEAPKVWGEGAPPALSPEGMQGRLLNAAGIAGGLGGAGSGVSGIRTGVTNATREVMGEGPSKANLLSDQHTHALATQSHLNDLANDVHTDAQGAMSNVLRVVDDAKPEGAFSKVDIQGKVQDAMGELVKVPEKMPSSVARILAKPKAMSWEEVAGKQVSDVQGFTNRLRDQGLSEPEIRSILQNEGLGSSAVKGTVSDDALTAEQLKQMRSDVGQELDRYGNKGAVGAGLRRVYSVLSDELRGAAKDAGVEKEWLTANDKYSQYARDFTNTKAPLRLPLQNRTASGIMQGLAGENWEVVKPILQKYSDAGFKVDVPGVESEIRGFRMGKTSENLMRPTKMDLALIRVMGPAAALRILGPRILANPKVLRSVAGEGLEPRITPRQVYPTKAAAMAARRGGGMGAEAPSEIEEAIRQRGSTRRAVEPTKEEVEGAQSRAERKAAEKMADRWMKNRGKKEDE